MDDASNISMAVVEDEIADDEAVALIIEDLLTSSDEEEKTGGSLPGRAPNKERDFIGAHAKLMRDYFAGPNSIYDEGDFERRFQMPRALFNRIHNRLMGKDPLFKRETV